MLNLNIVLKGEIMKYIIIAFKSRNNVMSFLKLLRINGIVANVINTPRTTSISCGLSIKTDYRNLNNVSRILSQTTIDGFLGVYLVTRNGMHEQTQRLF